MADNTEIRQIALSYAQDLVNSNQLSPKAIDLIKTCTLKTLYKIINQLLNN